jgi:hypothetical protein
MSLIKTIEGSDQLLLDGFRYRGDRSVWRCVKAGCRGHAPPDGTIFKMYKDHICQVRDPNEIVKALYNYEIKKKVAQCHDLPRLINFARITLALKCHCA